MIGGGAAHTPKSYNDGIEVSPHWSLVTPEAAIPTPRGSDADGLILSHSNAERSRRAEEDPNATLQPNARSRIGTENVDTMPPRFPAVFMIAPAAPASGPPTAIALDQKMVSTDKRLATLSESAPIAG